jgi:hypothetical protein
MVDVLIVDKRARLADQGVDHVAKVDPLFALAKQSRQTFQALVLIPEFQMVLVDQHVQLQADVLAADGIHVSPHMQEAIRFDRHARGRERGDALPRQSRQGFAFFPEGDRTRFVPARHDLPQERQVLLLVREVATPTHPQGLVKPRFQMPVRRLHIPVLLRLADVDPMALQAVMIEQRLVLLGEGLVLGEIVDGGGKAVAANPPRNAARQVQGVLKTRRQGLEGLRVTKVDGFPIGIREHRVEQQVVEGTASQSDPQSVHRDKVKREHVSRMMRLRERHFALDILLQFPLLHAPLQSPSNRVADHDLSGRAERRIVFLFQPIEQGKGPELRIPVQQFLDLGPIRLQRIRPRSILPRLLRLLARKDSRIAVLPNRPFTHLETPCNLGDRLSPVKHREHPARLFILEHRKPPWGVKSLR